MDPKSAIAKGKELEKWIIGRLKLFGLDKRAHRNPGSGSGLARGDINNALNIHFECKNQKQFGGKKWFNQMKKDNVSCFPEVLVWHLPNTPFEETKAIIDFLWLEELLLKAKNPPKLSELDKTGKWHLINLKNAIQQVIKDLEK